MAIKFSCACGKHFSVAELYAGKQSVCPSCKQPIVVPQPQAVRPLMPVPASPASDDLKAPMESVVNTPNRSTTAVQGNESACSAPQKENHSSVAARFLESLSRRWIIAGCVAATVAIAGMLIWFYAHDPMDAATKLMVNLSGGLAERPPTASSIGLSFTQTRQDDKLRDATFSVLFVPFREGVDGDRVKEVIGEPKWTEKDKEKMSPHHVVRDFPDEEWYYFAESHDRKQTIVHVFFSEGKASHAIVRTEQIGHTVLFR